MSADVLHVQTRAYPLHYGSINPTTAVVTVPGRGELQLVTGALGSQAYNPDATVDTDLTELVRAAVDLPGARIVGCRARLLAAGTVLVVYAMRHTADLAAMDTHQLAAFDARVNRTLRDADAAVIGEALDAVVDASVLENLFVIRSGSVTDSRPSTVDLRAVRYNCHLVTRDPSWAIDPRVPDLVQGPRCRLLLPYTYAWDADPATPLDEILTMQEPADVAVAQMSVLFSAMIGGRRILAELAGAALGPLRAHDFRRFLDRVWAEYHQLDFYRLESAQDHRATYLASREVIGLDRAQQRAGNLLDYVATSLMSESSLRSQQLDSRLNRVAAALTVVVAAEFAVEAASFLIPDAPWGTRAAVVGVVAVLALAVLGVTILTVRRERASRRRLPRPRAPDEREGGAGPGIGRRPAPPLRQHRRD